MQPQQFPQMIALSLSNKYSNKFPSALPLFIDDILQNGMTQIASEFRELQYIADDQEYLKRGYRLQEYEGKIVSLTEYYKFNRDVPRWDDPGIEKIMWKFYDKLRDVDFRRVKAVLKKEQNISLTSQHHSTSFSNSQIQQKSRYSTVLHGLLQDSKDESHVFHEMCTNIAEKFKGSKTNENFEIRGAWGGVPKKFEEFLKLKKDKKRNRKFLPDQFKKKKELNLNSHLRDIQIPRLGKSIESKSITYLNKKSLQKTAANDTLSREYAPSRYLQKPMTLRNIELPPMDKNDYLNQNQNFKPLSSGLIALKTGGIMKSIDQIYRSGGGEKYGSAKSKKNNAEGRSKSKKNTQIGPRPSSKSHRSHQAAMPSHPIQSRTIETDRVMKCSRVTEVRRASFGKRDAPRLTHRGTPIQAQAQAQAPAPNFMKQKQQTRRISKSKDDQFDKKVQRSVSQPKLSKNSSKSSISRAKSPSKPIPIPVNAHDFQHMKAASVARLSKPKTHQKLDNLLEKKLTIFRASHSKIRL